MEWARPSTKDCSDAGEIKEEIPYGLQVAKDCRNLEENPVEKAAMMAMLAMIVEDRPLSQVAEGLNQRGFRMRSADAIIDNVRPLAAGHFAKPRLEVHVAVVEKVMRAMLPANLELLRT